jgi:hypothetical protein
MHLHDQGLATNMLPADLLLLQQTSAPCLQHLVRDTKGEASLLLLLLLGTTTPLQADSALLTVMRA